MFAGRDAFKVVGLAAVGLLALLLLGHLVLGLGGVAGLFRRRSDAAPREGG